MPRSSRLRERLLRAVRDVARDLLVAELRRAGVDLVLVDVDRGEHVLLDEPLREHDRVLEVVALQRHERDEQVRAERELALVGRGAVGQHLARLDLLAQADDRLLVDQRALVRAHELRQVVLVACRPCASTTIRSASTSTTVPARLATTTSPVSTAARYSRPVPTSGACRDHQRHGLPLHVRAHERAVRVVVLEERDQRGRDRDDLRRRDVHEVDVVRRRHDGLALASSGRAPGRRRASRSSRRSAPRPARSCSCASSAASR